MPLTDQSARFEALVSAHLDAAYNLAHWLTRDAQDAQDCVQEAVLRALRYFDGFRGGDGRAWLLTIVRNTCFSLLKDRREQPLMDYDGHQPMLDEIAEESPYGGDPQMLLLRAGESRRVEAAMLALPAEFREVLVLREIEELAYKQIADIVGVPIGTVMSRLSRARHRLRRLLLELPE